MLLQPALLQSFSTLNTNKFCHLFLSHRRFYSKLSLTLNGILMTHVTSYKYLGIQDTSDLMWSDHIVKVCSKTRKLIGILYRTLRLLQTLNPLYHAKTVQLFYPTALVRFNLLGPPTFQCAAWKWNFGTRLHMPTPQACARVCLSVSLFVCQHKKSPDSKIQASWCGYISHSY